MSSTNIFEMVSFILRNTKPQPRLVTRIDFFKRNGSVVPLLRLKEIFEVLGWINITININPDEP